MLSIYARIFGYTRIFGLRFARPRFCLVSGMHLTRRVRLIRNQFEVVGQQFKALAKKRAGNCFRRHPVVFQGHWQGPCQMAKPTQQWEVPCKRIMDGGRSTKSVVLWMARRGHDGEVSATQAIAQLSRYARYTQLTMYMCRACHQPLAIWQRIQTLRLSQHIQGGGTHDERKA